MNAIASDCRLSRGWHPVVAETPASRRVKNQRELIEAQRGNHLGEDDIERLEDVCKRS
jgi:hypothetical protein